MEPRIKCFWQWYKVLGHGILCCLSPFLAHAVTLEWDPNPETNIAGYRVYFGSQSRVYDSVLDVANQTVAIIAARPGTSFYAVTAYNSDGLESDFSDEVSYSPPATNAAPNAFPDYYTTTRNLARTVPATAGVLQNDSDPDSPAITAVLVNVPANGSVVLNLDGSFTYTPNQDFTGQDLFGYRVSDGSMTSAVAWVTIVVNDVPPPGSENCAHCFADLDFLLTVRSNAFRPIIDARLSVPINLTCPQLGVFIFSTVSRAARTMNDPQLNAALASAAECIMSDLQNELATKSLRAAGLAPSRWTKTASNQLATARRYIDRASLTNSIRQARLLSAAAALLPRADKTLIAGDLAPLTIANKKVACRVSKRGQKWELLLELGEQNFVMEQDGEIVCTGQYLFTRTAWNEGELVLEFANAALGYESGESMVMRFRFGRTRHRLTSGNLRGYFTLHD